MGKKNGAILCASSFPDYFLGILVFVKLIVGLGNPGRKFAKTRHNAGHLFISHVKRQKGEFGKRVKLHMSTVFMNDSGSEIKKLIAGYQLPTANLLIAHDDLDLPLGGFKFQFGRSGAGHKGVQSIIDALGTKDFWRLRFGIGKPALGVTTEKYVLSKFNEGEFEQLQKAFEEAYPRVLEWVG